MRIDILTLFPEMCEAVLKESIIGRARENGMVEINCHQIRDFSIDKHNKVDDTPYGGGKGLIMFPQPIYDCFEAVCKECDTRPHLIYMSPQGKTLTQEKVKELSKLSNIAILCGHYEGVDERILEEIVDEEISIGDYVLTGGELPAMVLADSVARMLPGVLSSEECFTGESHYDSLLEYPQYTRPFEWHGRQVPDVLISGHHANIEKWRHEQSLTRTFNRRPDMLKKAELTKKDIEFLRKYTEDINYRQMQKNTVNSKNQLKKSEYVRFVDVENDGKKILFLGNSMTLHGVNADIGWHNEWGMAASAQENDYVHILMRKFAEKYKNPSFCICQVAEWERDYKNGTSKHKLYEDARTFDADIIVMRFIENCPGKDFDAEVFKAELKKLLDYFNPDSKAKIILTTGFWRHPGDTVVEKISKEENLPLALLGDLGEDEKMKAIGLFEHSGVANHPGDEGMKMIAERIFEKI